MKPLPILVAVAGLLFASVAGAVPFVAAAGVVAQTPISTVPNNGNGLCALNGGQGMSGALNVYIIWYDNPASTFWSTANKNIVRGWINGLATSPWFSMQQLYGTSAGAIPTGISLAAECVDPQTEGETSFSCVGADIGTNVINGQVTPNGCALANDTQGLYMIWPAPNVTTGIGAGCHGVVVNGGHNLVTMIGEQGGAGACNFGQVGGQVLMPNGVPGVDCLLYTMSHEMGEAIPDPNPLTGWTCFNGSTRELADICTGVSGKLNGYSLTNPGGQPYSWSFVFGGTTYYYGNQPIYQTGPANSCAEQNVPTIAFVQNCRTSLDCVVSTTLNRGWGNFCSGYHCVSPTCTDGAKDGDESDTDCGGSCMSDQATPNALCGSGKLCRSPADCFSGICTSGVCN